MVFDSLLSWKTFEICIKTPSVDAEDLKNENREQHARKRNTWNWLKQRRRQISKGNWVSYMRLNYDRKQAGFSDTGFNRKDAHGRMKRRLMVSQRKLNFKQSINAPVYTHGYQHSCLGWVWIRLINTEKLQLRHDSETLDSSNFSECRADERACGMQTWWRQEKQRRHPHYHRFPTWYILTVSFIVVCTLLRRARRHRASRNYVTLLGTFH